MSLCSLGDWESFQSWFFTNFNFSFSISRSYPLLLVGRQICLYVHTRNSCPSNLCGWWYQDWKSWWKIYQNVNRICELYLMKKQHFYFGLATFETIVRHKFIAVKYTYHWIISSVFRILILRVPSVNRIFPLRVPTVIKYIKITGAK